MILLPVPGLWRAAAGFGGLIMRKTFLAAVAAIMLSGSAEAAYVLNLSEVGGQVVASGSGSIDTSALTFNGLIGGNPYIGGSLSLAIAGAPLTGGSAAAAYIGIQPSTLFASGSAVSTTIGSGAFVGIRAQDNTLFVPQGYVSGTTLGVSTAQYNATFAAAGLVQGTYVYTFGTGASADSFTVVVGADVDGAVPEPAAWAMMVAGFGLVGTSMRRRRATIRFA